MNLGQTMLTVGALVILSLLTLSFYSSMGRSHRNIDLGQAGITESTIATSYIEIAQGPNILFDQVADSLDDINQNNFISSPTQCTKWQSLGRDNSGEDSIKHFNDFDDFNNWTEDKQQGLETYRVKFRVYYVDSLNAETEVLSQTFVKRMDIKVWRIYPPIDTLESPSAYDTARASCILGYFKFH